ncbi:hypothetical protein EJ07DRAFT_157672 [Lizonia empirigonia]|nr:hypothetical protein EJ07DRAFT_157672 [Lizonia empirigonia]
MNPLAASFVPTDVSNGIKSAEVSSSHKVTVHTQKVYVHRTNPRTSNSQTPGTTNSSNMISTAYHDMTQGGKPTKPTNYPQAHTEELSALRKANTALTQCLHEISQETHEEREARKLRQKNVEIEDLKASIERVTAQTEATKKELAERQTYLRELNAQVVTLQPPVQFAIKQEKGKGNC